MKTPRQIAPPIPGADFITRWADRANPIMVRSLRQEMRSKSFIATYALALILGCATAVGICLLHDNLGGGKAGQALFTVCAIAWLVAGWLVAGMTAFGALVRERNDDTWDLVELTGMGPRQVILGVWNNALIQSVIAFA